MSMYDFLNRFWGSFLYNDFAFFNVPVSDLKTLFRQKQPIRYRFIDRGSKDTVVFVHGLFSSSSIFRHFVELVDKNVILIELRGIVYSAIKKPFIQNYVRDIHSILEKENIKGNVILVGYSLGCAIANRFAEDFGHMVKKVIMLSPINRGIREIGLKKMVETLINSLGKDFFRKWQEYLRLENQWPVHKIFSLFNFRLLRESFQKIEFTAKSPVIIVNGLKDTFFDKSDERLKLPNVIRHTIVDLDHFLFLTKEGIQKIAVRLKKII